MPRYDPPPTITAADVPRATIRETVHTHGSNGMYIHRWICVQYPRLTKEARRNSRGAREVVTFQVDGADVPADAAAIAAALNKPHDLAGVADRFNAQRVRGIAVYIEGRLMVRGETAERCSKLRESYPQFEGVPIDWCAAVPEGE